MWKGKTGSFFKLVIRLVDVSDNPAACLPLIKQTYQIYKASNHTPFECGEGVFCSGGNKYTHLRSYDNFDVKFQFRLSVF